MPAPKENNYNKMWKTKEERQAAFKAVCLSLGELEFWSFSRLFRRS